MNLTQLSGLGFWLGALALAGALFALQRLRVRHREVVVPTTLFWRAALEETRARTLVERFRHPLSYLLLLAIALFGWLSFGAPVADRDDGSERLFLLDTSAAVDRASFDEAARLLVAEARRADRDHRLVVACGARLETLLAPGEDALLLDERLRAVEPDAAAPAFERALLVLAAGRDDARPLRVTLVGPSAVRDEVLAMLGDGVEVERVELEAPRAARLLDLATGPSGGIVADGAGRFDVWVRASANAAGVRLVDGDERLAPAGTTALVDGTERARFEGLVADGRALEVELGDQRAALVLPDRRALRVAVEGVLPGALDLALLAHAGVERVGPDDEADLAVRAAGSDFRADLPALELSDADGPDEAFVLVQPDAGDARSALFAALGDLGLEWIDGEQLASATQRTIAIADADGERRALRLWSSLCESGGAFARDPAFPLVVARSIDWLAGRDTPRFVARAGDAADTASGERAFVRDGDAERVRLASAGAPFTPARAGLYRSADDRGARVVLAAGPGFAPSLAADAAPARAALAAPSSAFDLTNLVLLALVLLLVVEWALVRTGRTP